MLSINVFETAPKTAVKYLLLVHMEASPSSCWQQTFIINIIHVAEDPLLSPLAHPPIALIKILINYYIFQSVIIFQMWILMNFSLFYRLAVHHH